MFLISYIASINLTKFSSFGLKQPPTWVNLLLFHLIFCIIFPHLLTVNVSFILLLMPLLVVFCTNFRKHPREVTHPQQPRRDEWRKKNGKTNTCLHRQNIDSQKIFISSGPRFSTAKRQEPVMVRIMETRVYLGFAKNTQNEDK